MSDLNEYLAQKRAALLIRNARDPAAIKPETITARATAEGRSGIRHIRIREHHIISDSPPDFAGYNLGPASPEIFIGSLSSCLTHIFLIHAADRQIPLSRLEVEVQADVDLRAGKEGYEDIPFYPFNLRYTVEIDSSADEAEITALHQAVETWCPVLNLIKRPQPLEGTIRYRHVAA
ncbi:MULTISPECIES: OsmC family protein [Brenneria]|uniref:OsmC family peroxiredoxin n=1 Tax=Brenneria nigrifluens DSM 30175 = ATCC 13028 TaxID=1121120 RepID=A0A2U1USF9_9GAMM|nr:MULTISPECIES: OsmC family protein [Brenneria]EHD21158.1 OsmC family protein [Brenneria sp. EniD312]PWC24575.1 OsmC family peroxiredoxin [Brenneria nigrifluens DSM 30175 = ATCC 13028]QCR04306.1 OsmC family peroxiredoxin [Brenneria nigrifluens DSM 30175 = ATCC 13028]